MTALNTEIEQELRCPFCGEQGELVYENLEDKLFKVEGYWNILRCSGEECGLAWMTPKPEGSALKDLYRNYYTHLGEGGMVQSQRGDSKYMRTPFLSYLRRFLGISIAREHAELLGLSHVAPGRLLDVGCGDGRRLSKFAAKGWLVEGIDVDEAAVRGAVASTGFHISLGSLGSLDLPDNTYDAVIMNHVLEHVEYPLEHLTASMKLLKRGGYLVVRVPNFNSRGHDFFKDFWIGIEVPRHLHHFTCASLKKLADMTGMHGYTVYSDNANAETVFTSSYLLHRNISTYEPDKLGKVPRIFSLLWQVVSGLDLHFNPDKGEECILMWRAP